MAMKVALLFSGQGAQSVGMGKSLYAGFAAARAIFDEADRVLGRSLTSLMFEGPEAELTRTANCQPALFVHGLAALAALREKAGDFEFAAAAGLSLGEFTAHTAAGTFAFADGLRIVERRGQLMEEACIATSGAMAAMIGGDPGQIRRLADACDVDVANWNCPGQIVLSGESAKIDRAVERAKESGVRKAARLNVAGAYHSRLMQSARNGLAETLASTLLSAPSCIVVANFTAGPVTTPEEIRESLTMQVTGSVRWSESVDYLLDQAGCNQFLELGPGGVLAGMMGRIRKGIPVFGAESPEGIEAVTAALKE